MKKLNEEELSKVVGGDNSNTINDLNNPFMNLFFDFNFKFRNKKHKHNHKNRK